MNFGFHRDGPARFDKIWLFRLAVAVLFAVLVVQLARLQIVEGESYEERAQQNSIAVVELPAERGTITDRNGVVLAENSPGYDAVAIPGRIPSERFRETVFTLEGLLDVPAERIARLITEGEEEAAFAPVILKENLTREEALTLRAMEPDLRGISLQIAANRRYRSGPLLAPITGYVGPISEEAYAELRDEGYSLGDRLGLGGIELEYERFLRGEDGRKLIEQDALGRELRLVDERAPVPGNRVELTIDYSLQVRTAEILEQAREEEGAPVAAAVVLDVRTGEMLALVSLPSYDANEFAQGITERRFEELTANTEERPLVNHAISDAFAPGSIFKVITAATALDQGTVDPDTRIYSPGYLDVKAEFEGGETTRFNDTANGTFDFSQGIAASSNVYFYCLAASGQPGSQFFDPGCGPDEVDGVGPGNLARMAAAFGLGQLTGIDLPGEFPGSIPPTDQDGDPNNADDDTGDTVPDVDVGPEDPDKGLSNLSAWFANLFYENGGSPGEPWRLGTTLQFAIGQNVVTTTPLQMAVVAAAIANGGNVIEPHLLDRVVAPDGSVVLRPDPAVRGRVPLSDAELALISEGMHEAVMSTYGTATAAFVPGVEVAGKTGSPQIEEIDVGTGKRLTHAWFIGFAPFDNPEIAVAVYIQAGTGGATAAPLAGAIFEAYFNRTSVLAP